MGFNASLIPRIQTKKIKGCDGDMPTLQM